jgi:hypothetical protein
MNTLKIFKSMDRFNPDKTWHPTGDEWPGEEAVTEWGAARRALAIERPRLLPHAQPREAEAFYVADASDEFPRVMKV